MNVVSVALYWLFITYLDGGTNGAAMALTLVNMIQAGINFFVARNCISQPTWPKYRHGEMFNVKGWAELLRLSLPGALTVRRGAWARNSRTSSSICQA